MTLFLRVTGGADLHSLCQHRSSVISLFIKSILGLFNFSSLVIPELQWPFITVNWIIYFCNTSVKSKSLDRSTDISRSSAVNSIEQYIRNVAGNPIELWYRSRLRCTGNNDHRRIVWGQIRKAFTCDCSCIFRECIVTFLNASDII